MIVSNTVAAVREHVRAFRAAGETVALVPTMGYLHEGHLTLVRAAHSHASRVIVSIFVNPTQFGPSEDLERYPRDEAGDRAKLESVGTDMLFLPGAAEMYPRGYQTWVSLDALPGHLCGVSRPVHFRGVATVCTKLFNIVQPDAAIFGEKDFQQLLVIRRMVADLDMPVRVVGVPIVREPDGLAMSSRNAYLSPDERARAVAIVRSLEAAEQRVASGERDALAIRSGIVTAIGESGGRVDYVSLVDPVTLDEVELIDGPVQAAVAAHYGATRLIDNRRLSP